MPRTCTICSHPHRELIEQSLLEKVPLRTIADQCLVSKAALLRHRPHISPASTLQHAERDATRALSLAEQIAQLQADAHRIGAAAEKDGDRRTALMAIRELVRIADLLARMQGAIKEPVGGTVKVEVVYIDKAVIAASPTPPALPPGDRSV